MPMTCSILGCSSRYSKEKNIKFFRFPLKDNCRLTAWLNGIKRENWIPSKYDTVCNKHFTINDFVPCRETYKTFLRPTAVPSIFPSSTRNNERNKHTIKKIGNKSKRNENNIERTNIHTDDETTNRSINDTPSDIHSEVNNENIKNIYTTMVGAIEEPNTYNVNITSSNINLNTYNSETVSTEPRVTSSAIYKPMKIEKDRINNYHSLDRIKSNHVKIVKNSPTTIEENLRHKIRMLQQKLRRRDAKIMYLRRLLIHLKQKKDILSVIQHL